MTNQKMQPAPSGHPKQEASPEEPVNSTKQQAGVSEAMAQPAQP